MKWLLLAIVVVSVVLGDLLQSYEMKLAGKHSGGVVGAWRVLRLIAQRRYLILSIICMAISFFAFLALVQTEPISFAVPASAGSFVLETLLARTVLKERLSNKRVFGALFVFAGILLVAR